MSDKVPLQPVRLLQIQSTTQLHLRSLAARASALVLADHSLKVRLHKRTEVLQRKRMDRRKEKVEKDRNRCLSIKMLEQVGQLKRTTTRPATMSSMMEPRMSARRPTSRRSLRNKPSRSARI